VTGGPEQQRRPPGHGFLHLSGQYLRPGGILPRLRPVGTDPPGDSGPAGPGGAPDPGHVRRGRDVSGHRGRQYPQGGHLFPGHPLCGGGDAGRGGAGPLRRCPGGAGGGDRSSGPGRAGSRGGDGGPGGLPGPWAHGRPGGGGLRLPAGAGGADGAAGPAGRGPLPQRRPGAGAPPADRPGGGHEHRQAAGQGAPGPGSPGGGGTAWPGRAFLGRPAPAGRVLHPGGPEPGGCADLLAVVCFFFFWEEQEKAGA
jgi:hypothetical protein